MPNILLLNQVFYPDVVSTAQHLTDFAIDLAKKGHDVTVLASRRGYTEPHLFYPPQEIYQGVKILRVGPLSFGRKMRIARWLDAFMMNAAFAWRLLWLPRFDKVIAMTTPPLVAWIGLVFARIHKSEFLYWVMDINPDQAIAAGWISQGTFRTRLLEKALKFILKESSKIVVLDSFMKERLESKGAAPQKIAVIPTWSHDDDLETLPHEQNPFRKKHDLDNRFVVMYSGNHSLCHPLDTLLEAALILKKDPSVVFLFIGGGDRVNDVIQFQKRHHLDQVIHLPYQERADLKYSLSAADLHTVVMGEPYVGIVHPCKIYSILKIGRPFVYVGPVKSHIGALMDHENVGWRVSPGDPKRLVEIIREVQKLSPSPLQAILNREQKVAEKYFREKLSSQLADLVAPSFEKAVARAV